MVFVDDFLAAFHSSESSHAYRIRDHLVKRFKIKHTDELTQFIGIRITRHRPTRRT